MVWVLIVSLASVCRLKKESCTVLASFQHKIIFLPKLNLSLSFILKIFLKFRKFLPQYSYKIYSYRKKSVFHWMVGGEATFLGGRDGWWRVRWWRNDWIPRWRSPFKVIHRMACIMPGESWSCFRFFVCVLYTHAQFSCLVLLRRERTRFICE